VNSARFSLQSPIFAQGLKQVLIRSLIYFVWAKKGKDAIEWEQLLDWSILMWWPHVTIPNLTGLRVQQMLGVGLGP
jgi:hypothetical protein